MLLGSTAVIRLKSPLAHVSYSSGSKVRPPDQYGEELADAKFCMCTRFPRLLERGAFERFRWGQKADTKDFTTLGQFGPSSQTGWGPHHYPQLCLTTLPRLWMKWLTAAKREPQRCNYPQAVSQLSSRLFIP